MEAFLNGKGKKVPLVTCQKEDREERSKTVRLEIDLVSPTDHNTNEISYVRLVKGKTTKRVKKDPLDEFSPDKREEGDKLSAIAKFFEEKYGTCEQDLVDIGKGYDSNDSFVDDSELYEDYVPPSVDTALGGFYVNTGNLEFKRNSKASDLTPEIGASKSAKPKLKKQGSHFTPKAILANKKLKRAKQQVASSAQRTKNYKKKLLNYSHTNTSSILSDNMEGGGSSDHVSEVTSDTNMSLEDSNESKVLTPRELPAGLSHELTSKIQQLEEAISKDQVGNGKLSYRAKTSYDSILVDIDIACKPLRLKMRMGVFEYLAYKLGINRSSLSNRIKRIHKKREPSTYEGPMEELKKAIDLAMPPLLEKYNTEMEKYETERKSLMPPTTPSSSDIKIENNDDMVVSEEVQISETTPTNGSVKKLRRPSKKFQWTDRIRTLVFQVVQAKVDQELFKTDKSQSGEEIINKFLEGQVKTLWPKGWVQKRTLYKMTEPVHGKLTQSTPADGNQSKKTTTQQSAKKITIKKEPLNEDSTNTSTPIVTRASPLLKVGVTTSPITTSLLSPISTTPTSRSIALKNLQTQLSVLKSSNATLLSNTILVNSPPLITTPTIKATPPQAASTNKGTLPQTVFIKATPPQTAPTRATPPQTAPIKATLPHVVTPTRATPPQIAPTKVTTLQAAPTKVILPQIAPIKATPPQISPTRATPPKATPLLPNTVVMPVSSSSPMIPQTIISKGGKSNVIVKDNKPSLHVASKGLSKISKKTIPQNILSNVPKDTLEAILSALNNPSMNSGMVSGGIVQTSPSSVAKQLVLTSPISTTSSIINPHGQQVASPLQHTQYVTTPTRYGTPPTQYVAPLTHQMTPPAHYATPPTIGGIATTLSHPLTDHHYITTTVPSSFSSFPFNNN